MYNKTGCIHKEGVLVSPEWELITFELKGRYSLLRENYNENRRPINSLYTIPWKCWSCGFIFFFSLKGSALTVYRTRRKFRKKNAHCKTLWNKYHKNSACVSLDRLTNESKIFTRENFVKQGIIYLRSLKAIMWFTSVI